MHENKLEKKIFYSDLFSDDYHGMIFNMKTYFEYKNDLFWAIRTNGCDCITAEDHKKYV